MKLKYFLRGLGTGLIITALVLCITYRKSNAGVDVVERAKELGMVFPESTETPPEETVVPEETPAPTVGEEPTETPAQTVAPVASGAGVSSAKSGGKRQSFTVRGGLLSSSVARELKKAGIIDDADAFDDYLEESGYGRKIIAGNYKIPKNASYEQIAKIITKQE